MRLKPLFTVRVGPWWVALRNPFDGGKRPPKNWYCVHPNCSQHGKGVRLTDSGSCKGCGQSLRREGYR